MEALDEDALHAVRLVVDDDVASLDADGPQAETGFRGMADGAVVEHDVDEGFVERGLLRRPPRRRRRPEERLDLHDRLGRDVDVGLPDGAERADAEAAVHRRGRAVPDFDKHADVVGIGVHERVRDDERAMTLELHRLPDPPVRHVEARTARGVVVRPALLPVREAKVLGVVDVRVEDTYCNLVRSRLESLGHVEGEGCERAFVRADRLAVHIHLGNVHHRAEAKRPETVGRLEPEAAPVPRDPVELEVPLALPEARNADLLGVEAVERAELVIPGEELPRPVERRDPVLVEGEACRFDSHGITSATLPLVPVSASAYASSAWPSPNVFVTVRSGWRSHATSRRTSSSILQMLVTQEP